VVRRFFCGGLRVPFTAKDFKDACHERATCVAILTTKIADNSKGPIKATVVTEHSASFPSTDADDCYISVIIGAQSDAYKAIVEREYFGLSFLSRDQLDLANAIYTMDLMKFREIRWGYQHQVPYIQKANGSIICSLKSHIPIGPNVIVVGHVMDAFRSASPTKPLVNYQRSFRSVDDEAVLVQHPPRGPNTRL
jgi:flavin reductase (DIM6/NTAB) family NADH-FMN oxidoreductase RutF